MLRLAIKFLASFGFLVILWLGTLPYLINTDPYKEKLEYELSVLLNSGIQISGLHLHTFGQFALELKNTTLTHSGIQISEIWIYPNLIHLAKNDLKLKIVIRGLRLPSVIHDLSAKFIYEGSELNLVKGDLRLENLPLPITQIKGKIHINTETIQVPTIFFQFGTSTFLGSGNYSFGPRNFNFILSSNELLLDELITNPKTSASEFTLPSWLGEMTGLFRIRLQKLIAQDLELNDVTTNIRFKSDRIEASPLSFKLAQGEFHTWTTLFFKTPIPEWTLLFTLQRLDSEQFLMEQRSPAHEDFSGGLYGKFSFKTKGLSKQSLMQNLGGRGIIQFREGHLTHFNFSQAILKKLPKVGLQLFSPEENPYDQYKLIQTMCVIGHEKIQFKNIELYGEQGMGIQANVTVGFDQSLQGNGTYYLKLQGDQQLAIPFALHGSLQNPKPLPYMEKAVQSFLTQKAKKLFSSEKAFELIHQGVDRLYQDVVPWPF